MGLWTHTEARIRILAHLGRPQLLISVALPYILYATVITLIRLTLIVVSFK
jgi:hypothetical protein